MLAVVQVFHDGMQGTVPFDGTMSESFPIQKGVKPGCVLAPTMFGICLSGMLSQTFGPSREGIYLHSRSDGKLLKISMLKAKIMRSKVLVCEHLFADDSAIVSHTESGLQSLVDSFSDTCNDFGPKISLTKPEMMSQGYIQDSMVSFGEHRLNTVTSFTYLGRTVKSKLKLDTEINKIFGKAPGVTRRLKSSMWKSSQLKTKTKLAVYRACELSKLVYGSEC